MARISDEAKALHKIRNLTEPDNFDVGDPVQTVMEANRLASDAWRDYLRKIEADRQQEGDG